MSAFDDLSAEKQAAVNAKIIEGFSSQEIYKDGLTQLEYYSKELRAIKDPDARADKFQELLGTQRDSEAQHADNLTFSKTEGLSGGRSVLIKIKEALVTNVDKNAKDYSIDQMDNMVDSLRKQFHYGEEKISLRDVKIPAGVCVGPSVDMSEDVTPPLPASGSKESSCGHKR